ncbi:mitochondrial 37S ribosomal protein [Starmerella bacillaris]|uniref:Mitochondrial 37S ribosomal protein n=1 Tax=Starmerella bacillaris TaxID=1247836 RepID=A0AAV5RHW3_STABA|nr:mitochondrial 37S ribosomal protein [Starmerella bacillaris]
MKGLIRIRLARFGRRHQPVYNIVVAHHKKANRKLPIEVIGTYNPVADPLTPQQIKDGNLPVKDIRLDFLKATYWLGTGAQPSPTVARLFIKAGLLPPNWTGKEPMPQKVLVEKHIADDIAPPSVR